MGDAEMKEEKVATALPSLLVVDDEAPERLALCGWLKGLYQVGEAGDLGSALDQLRHGPPAAVVVDLNLGPGREDWGLTLAQLAEATHAPIVIWTGDESAARQPLRGLLLRGGADAVVLKQSGHPAELLNALSDSRDRHARDEVRTHRRLAAVEAALAALTHQVRLLVEAMQPPAPEEEATEIRRRETGVSRPGMLAALAGLGPRRLAEAAAGLGAAGVFLGWLIRAVWTGLYGAAPAMPVVEQTLEDMGE